MDNGNQKDNNIISLSEYRKKNWKKQEEIVAGGEGQFFMEENEQIDLFDEQTAFKPQQNMSHQKNNILSLSKHREKNQKKGLSGQQSHTKKKERKLLNFPNRKQKKHWKKNLSFYGQEASQVVAMAFVFVFLFVFALHFNDSTKENPSRSLASPSSHKFETEKDYIKNFKQRERVKSTQ